MKPLVTLSLFLLCATTSLRAQTFLDHLQKDEQGQATVKVVQSKEIDELVNGTKPKAPAATTKKQDDKARQEPNKNTPKENTPHKETAAQPKGETHADKKEADTAKKEGGGKPDTHTKKPDTRPETAEATTTVVDTRKKVMVGSKKVNGFRVQVYAGGNSRDDKVKAQQAGSKVKAAMPHLPVYVHFNSPRWICRVGNFKTQQEANNVLRQVRNMGFKQATVVAQQITVQR